MPTPIEILFDPISLVILATYAGLMAWEWLAPGPGASSRVADMMLFREVNSNAPVAGSVLSTYQQRSLP